MGNKKSKNYKGIIAVLGIAVLMLCGAVGTGIINSNGYSSSEIFGLTYKVIPFQKTLDPNDSSKISTKESPVVAHAASKKYVGSWNSNVYHKKWCRYVKKIKKYNKRYFSSAKAAKRAGYRPCKVCF